jgi:hypothetical protein
MQQSEDRGRDVIPSTFFNFITENFGAETCNILRVYANAISKLARYTARKDFLQECKKTRTIPRFIIDKTTVFSSLRDQIEGKNFKLKSKIDKFQDNFQNSMLRLEIDICFDLIRNLDREILEGKNSIQKSLPIETSGYFLQTQKDKYSRIFETTSINLNKKFEKLYENQCVENNIEFDEECFLNLTNVQFPVESRILLSFGSKFSVPTSNEKLPIMNLLNEIESIIQCNVNENQKNLARQKTIECFNDLMNHEIKFDKNEDFILRAQKSTSELIRKNKEIYIVNSDKGNKTVAIYKSDYEKKVEELLNDKNTYEKITQDPTKRLLKRRVELIDNLGAKSI